MELGDYQRSGTQSNKRYINRYTDKISIRYATTVESYNRFIPIHTIGKTMSSSTKLSKR